MSIFNKWPCRLVEFKGQDPPYAVCRDRRGHAVRGLGEGGGSFHMATTYFSILMKEHVMYVKPE